MHNRKHIHYYDSLQPIRSHSLKDYLVALAYIVFFFTIFSFAYFSLTQAYNQCNQGDVAACMILASN